MNNIDVSVIKNEISPYDFFIEELSNMPIPRGDGWQEGGLCPFHHDKNVGSFKVNISTGSYCCFACGVKGGDIVAFVQQKYELTFVESLYKIAEEWGVN